MLLIPSIYPWNLSKVNMKKLTPRSLYNLEEPLPEVAVDKSLIDKLTPTPLTPGTAPIAPTTGTAPIPLTPVLEVISSTSNDEQIAMKSLQPSETLAMFVNEPMFMKIGGKKLKLVEEIEESVEGKEEKIARILDMPKVMMKVGRA